MRVIVSGGRDYTNINSVFQNLDWLDKTYGVEVLIQGGATGADYLAKTWAYERGKLCIEYKADWKTLGRRAGPVRNQQMLDEANPDLVVFFPGGIGTEDMKKRTTKAGIKMVVFYDEILRSPPPDLPGL
jgi:hypothetical protein